MKTKSQIKSVKIHDIIFLYYQSEHHILVYILYSIFNFTIALKITFCSQIAMN